MEKCERLSGSNGKSQSDAAPGATKKKPGPTANDIAYANVLLGPEQICRIVRFRKEELSSELIETFLEGYSKLDIYDSDLGVEVFFNQLNCRLLKSYDSNHSENIAGSCDDCSEFICFKLQYAPAQKKVIKQYVVDFVAQHHLVMTKL